MHVVICFKSFARSCVLAALVLLVGCVGDAERGNPLDPMSGNFDDAGAVAGTITSFFAPFQGIEGVRVRLMPLTGGEERVGVTDPSGRFSLSNIPAGAFQISTDADGFEAALDTVTVLLGQLVEVTIPINGIPTVEITAIHTENLDRWFPQDPIFQLVVEASVDDPDGLGDVGEVRFNIPALGFSDTLRVVVGEPGVYGRIFSETELPVSSQDLLGLPLHVEATDNQGVQGSTPAVQIVRIIASFPQGIDPTASDIVGPQPTLVWRMFDLPYSFTNRVDISFVPVPGQDIPLLSYTGIAPTDTTFTLPDVLQAGMYSWTVSAVDGFGNTSRSKIQGFAVGSGPLHP